MELPAIDKNVYGKWTPEQRELYARYPFFLIKYTALQREYRGVWDKFFSRVTFERNAGEKLQMVSNQPTPVLRQFVRPSPLYELPMVDVNFPREKLVEGALFRHRFVSQHFQWAAHFTQFMRDKVEVNRRDIVNQEIVFEEEFYRTQVWDNSPYVYVAGYGLIEAPVPKTDTWLKEEVLPKVKTTLNLKEVYKIQGSMYADVGAVPWEGPWFDDKQNSRALDSRYLLVAGNEVWESFIDDPWVKENRPINLNIITDSLRGDLWGRVRFRPEFYPIHILASEDFTPSFPPPETVSLSGPDSMRPRPHPDYAIKSQYAISWILGKPGYRIIDTSPPPPFSAFGDTPLQWNGMPRLTDKFLVPFRTEDGSIKEDLNSWGEYLRFQAELVVGMVPVEVQQVVPIVHFRNRRELTTIT